MSKAKKNKENQLPNAWAVRPYPHGIYRCNEFKTSGMAALGWPLTGDLSGFNREQIYEIVKEKYKYDGGRLAQTVGVIDRFVNQIVVGDAIAVPDGDIVYFGIVTSGYSFKPELASDDMGFPHWLSVSYRFEGNAILRCELPAVLFDALKGRQSVFRLPAEDVWDVINNPRLYSSIDKGDPIVKADYINRLSTGKVMGINSPRFEEAVMKVLSFYFPSLERLPTTNAPVGADTDLKTVLPGGVVIRVQVKCYQDEKGELQEKAVKQLRDSMDIGEHGIVVTTNRVSESAQRCAASDPNKPVGIIDGSEFAQLVLDNLERLSDKELWTLGLRRALTVRAMKY